MSIVAALFVILFTRLPALASGRSLARQRRFGPAAALLGIGAYTVLVRAGPRRPRGPDRRWVEPLLAFRKPDEPSQ